MVIYTGFSPETIFGTASTYSTEKEKGPWERGCADQAFHVNANSRGRGKRAFLKGFTASFLENGIGIELFCRREDPPGNAFGCEKEFKRTGL